MILELWIIFMVLSFILVFIGYWRDADIFKIVGWSFLFIFSMLILTGNLEYHVGDVINETSATITVIIPQYQSYQDNTIGIFLTVVAFFGFILTFYDMRSKTLKGGLPDDGTKRIRN